MKPYPLDFAQKCLVDIDHDYLTFFDLKKGADSSFSTYPQQWCDRYVEQKYYVNDFVHMRRSPIPFAWGEKISKSMASHQVKIFKEAQDFGIFKGITSLFSSGNTQGAITLSFNKNEKLTQSKILKIGQDLQHICQLIATYKDLLEMDPNSCKEITLFLEEVAQWQKENKKQKKRKNLLLQEVLSDIRAAQMLIEHHETKECALEALHRISKDIERLF
ncbi:MAG: hypothetical protein FJX71_04790 [Alphaproteobacteria bacterium]|nr:hypothetical protein [Alphaproteobacteria bacterium]